MGTRARLLAPGFDRPLQLESFEPPALERGHVLVQVAACAVCYRDLIDRSGRFPWLQIPITPGHEAAGTVIAVGDGVTDFAIGDRVATLHRNHCGLCEACADGRPAHCPNAFHVFGLTVDGGYASHVIAPQNALYRLTADLPFEHACFLHCTAGTAYRGLVRTGGIRAGERVLVTGANGGVGGAAIQVAKRLGAEVTAVVRSEDHRAFVERMGADKVVVDSGTSFHKRIGDPAEVVLDCVGSPTFNSSLRSLKMGGRLVAIGNISPEQASLNLGQVIVFGLQIHGSASSTRQDMEELQDLHSRHPFDLASLVDRVLPLDQAEAAQLAVRDGGLAGRIVLIP